MLECVLWSCGLRGGGGMQPVASADEPPWILQDEVRFLVSCGLIGVYSRIVKIYHNSKAPR